jgi:poly(ADP-ribose) glycohydrolase ARH3
VALQHGLSRKPVEMESFLDGIVAQVRDLNQRFAEYIDEIRTIPGGSVIEVIDAITSRYELSLRAIESVPAALAAFLLTRSFREAVVLAVNLGGDTDTIGAMAGAVAGAYYGYDKIPQEWLSSLENAQKGRDYVVKCVKQIVSSWSRPS